MNTILTLLPSSNARPQHHKMVLRAMGHEDLDGMWALFRAHTRMRPQASHWQWGKWEGRRGHELASLRVHA